MRSLKQLWQQVKARNEDDRGASLVEYALLIALIAVVCIAAVTVIGNNSSTKYSEFADCWSWAGTGGTAPSHCTDH